MVEQEGSKEPVPQASTSGSEVSSRMPEARPLTPQERIDALGSVVTKLFRVLTPEQRRQVLQGNLSVNEKLVLTQAILTGTEHKHSSAEKKSKASTTLARNQKASAIQTPQATEQPRHKSSGSLYERVAGFVGKSQEAVTAKVVIDNFIQVYQGSGVSEKDIASQVRNVLELLASSKDLTKNSDDTFSKV